MDAKQGGQGLTEGELTDKESEKLSKMMTVFREYGYTAELNEAGDTLLVKQTADSKPWYSMPLSQLRSG